MVKLLEQWSLDWLKVHSLSKPILINALGYLRAMFSNIIENKKEKGWVNPEAGLLYEILTVIIERDEILRKGEDDHLKQAWQNIRDIGTTLADEDSHYMLRVLYFVELVHEFYPLFNIETHRNKAYWNWEQIYAGLQKNAKGDKEAAYSETYEKLKKRLEAISNGRIDTPDKPAGISNRGISADVPPHQRND